MELRHSAFYGAAIIGRKGRFDFIPDRTSKRSRRPVISDVIERETACMKPKQLIKISVDISMMIFLLLLMAYERIGQAAHEWLGIGLFILFLVHHLLNRGWHAALAKGRYSALRIWQTVLVSLALVTMLGAMVSGAVISRHALRFLSISGGQSFGRTMHLLSVYWGFVVMSLHLGFHWQMLLGGGAPRAKSRPGHICPSASSAVLWICRARSQRSCSGSRRIF